MRRTADTAHPAHIAKLGGSMALIFPLLGLVGVCKAAAIEFAFGGYTPPISRCETGKLFQARRTRSQRKDHPVRVVFSLAPPVGLEPTTS